MGINSTEVSYGFGQLGSIFSDTTTTAMIPPTGKVFVAVHFLEETNLAATGGLVAAMILASILYGKVDLSLALNGALAGLVSITAGPDVATPLQAIIIGAVGGVLCTLAIPLLDKLKIDDVVGAISVHLVAGIWGTLVVGIPGLGTLAADFITQLIGVVTIGVFVVVASSIVWLILKGVVGLRPTEEEEMSGLDVSELGMEAYPEFRN